MGSFTASNNITYNTITRLKGAFHFMRSLALELSLHNTETLHGNAHGLDGRAEKRARSMRQSGREERKGTALNEKETDGMVVKEQRKEKSVGRQG